MKLVFLYLCRIFGFFYLSRIFTRNSIKVLCYHGFSFDDEHVFRPGLFITAELLEQRMRYLSENNFNIIPLDEAVDAVTSNVVKPDSVVITIDDGFYSVLAIAQPILKSFQFPSTLYVTTYYVTKQFPIFRLALQYMFWKTRNETIDLEGFLGSYDLDCIAKFGQECGKSPDNLMWSLIDLAETQLVEEERQQLLSNLANILDIDYLDICNSRKLSLIKLDESSELINSGMDLQLHTHRHRLPLKSDEATKEVEENRQILNLMTPRKLNHFCYPSGLWDLEHWPVLRNAQIKSATTVEPGLYSQKSNVLAIPRFLDAQHISQIEFEAEVCGFKEILRDLKRVFVK